MKSESDFEKVICEFCDCEREADLFDEELNAWLCEIHANACTNQTGYCNQQCILGYGCDGSC